MPGREPNRGVQQSGIYTVLSLTFINVLLCSDYGSRSCRLLRPRGTPLSAVMRSDTKLQKNHRAYPNRHNVPQRMPLRCSFGLRLLEPLLPASWLVAQSPYLGRPWSMPMNASTSGSQFREFFLANTCAWHPGRSNPWATIPASRSSHRIGKWHPRSPPLPPNR